MRNDDSRGQLPCHLRSALVPCLDELGCAAEVLVVKSTTVAPQPEANIKRGSRTRNTELRMNSKGPDSEMFAFKLRRLAENPTARLA